MKHHPNIVFILFLLSFHTAWASPSLISTAQIDNKTNLLLSSSEEKSLCLLSIKADNKETQTLKLSIKSPCYFFPDNKNKAAQIYAYNDSGVTQVLLIGGTPATLSAKEKIIKKVKDDSYCTQEIQGLTLKTGIVKIANKMQAFACANDRLDEKLYQQVLKQKTTSLAPTKQPKTSFFGSLKNKVLGIFD